MRVLRPVYVTVAELLLACLFCLPLSGCIMACVTPGKAFNDCPLRDRQPPTAGTLSDFAVSPDGRLVAFAFRDDQHQRHGWGIFDRQSGRLTRVDAELSAANFSPDGKQLIVRGGKIINLADLSSMQLALSPGDAPGAVIYHPAFDPYREGSLVFQRFAGQPAPNTLPLYEIAGYDKAGQVTSLSPTFGTIKSIAFAGKDEILFMAGNPADPEYARYAITLGKPPTLQILYTMRLGERPRPYDNAIFLDLSVPSRDYRLDGVSASYDGRTILALSVANTATEQNVPYYHEIYRLDGKTLTQVTHLERRLRDLALSGDGSTAVFGYDVARDRNVDYPGWDADLAVLDLRTGIVTETGLLQRVKSDPQFRH